MPQSPEYGESQPDGEPQSIITELHRIAVQWQEEAPEVRDEHGLHSREVAVLSKLETALTRQAFSDAEKPALIAALEEFAEWIDTINVIERVDVLLKELRRE